MNKNRVQEEIKRVKEIESMKLKQLSEMDCNLEVTKKCDGCDLVTQNAPTLCKDGGRSFLASP